MVDTRQGVLVQQRGCGNLYPGRLWPVEQLESWVSTAPTRTRTLTLATNGDSPGMLMAHRTSRSHRCCTSMRSSGAASVSAKPQPPGEPSGSTAGYISGDADVSWTLWAVSARRGGAGGAGRYVHGAEADESRGRGAGGIDGGQGAHLAERVVAAEDGAEVLRDARGEGRGGGGGVLSVQRAYDGAGVREGVVEQRRDHRGASRETGGPSSAAAREPRARCSLSTRGPGPGRGQHRALGQR